MQKIVLKDNWTFFRGRTPDKKEVVCLPHDAMISEERGSEAPSGAPGAYFYGDIYTYERSFFIPEDWADKTITLEFEGVYRHATVWLNGQKLGYHAYGYMQFAFELNEVMKVGADNVLKVEVDNSKMKNSRWYSGSGIYRPVNLWVQEPGEPSRNGIQVTTLSLNPATIQVKTDAKVDLPIEIKHDGVTVASTTGTAATFTIEDAVLWSEDTPELYECIVGDRTLRFGIRMLSWGKEGFLVNGKSILLKGGCVHHDNGILGACALKEAEYRKVRIMKEQGFNAIRSAHNPCSQYLLDAADEMGMYIVDEAYDYWYVHKCNADDADTFRQTWKEDISEWVYRNYNHPSVIMYSLVNEPSETSKKTGQKMLDQMSNVIRTIDPTRPIGAGINLLLATFGVLGVEVGYNGEESESSPEKPKQNTPVAETKEVNGSAMFNMAMQKMGNLMNKMVANPATEIITDRIFSHLDICGYNYGSGRYKRDATRLPNRVIFGSETVPMHIYDNWNLCMNYPNVIGDFMWTGWDYLGEVGIGSWSYVDDGMMMNKKYPFLLGEAGVIDILGHPGGESWYAAKVWGTADGPQICVRPVNHPGIAPTTAMWRGTNAIKSWSFHDCDGNEAHVEVYSDAPQVELLINGVSIGRQVPKKDIATFMTKYKKGKITAIEYDGSGRELGRSELLSAIGSLKLACTPEEESISAGDCAFVSVNIVGENGVVESNADCMVDVSVENGTLLAFGSALPSTEDRYYTGHFKTHYGRSLAIIRASGEGNVKLTASSKLGTAEAVLPLK